MRQGWDSWKAGLFAVVFRAPRLRFPLGCAVEHGPPGNFDHILIVRCVTDFRLRRAQFMRCCLHSSSPPLLVRAAG
jgi:hypothetical protein